ncbi:MAG: hypothetical protein BYD32DRAFT_426616 [Podila humilis]|nr:MAG: hypothetical protein BYD32DRAFT_426616 [Podila humilis]
MVSIVALIMTPVLLGAIIYGATIMFSKHSTEPQKDANNTTDLLNATIHMASVIATLSWHHTTVSPPRATPDLINSAPSPDTKDPLQVGKKPLDEEEASTKAPSSQLNHHPRQT